MTKRQLQQLLSKGNSLFSNTITTNPYIINGIQLKLINNHRGIKITTSEVSYIISLYTLTEEKFFEVLRTVYFTTKLSQ